MGHQIKSFRNVKTRERKIGVFGVGKTDRRVQNRGGLKAAVPLKKTKLWSRGGEARGPSAEYNFVKNTKNNRANSNGAKVRGYRRGVNLRDESDTAKI